MKRFETGTLKYFFETDDICSEDENLYFSAKNYDALVSIDMNSGICRIEKRFFAEYTTTFCAHSKSICYKNCVFCIPRYSHYIIKYELQTGIVSKFMVPDMTDNKSVFTEAVRVGGKIICFPEFYDWIISFDMDTNDISKIEKIAENSKPESYIFTSNAAERENKILIPFFNGDRMLQFDKNTKDISIIDLNIKAKGISGIACDRDYTFLKDDNTCYALNDDGKELAKWENASGILYTINNSAWIVDKTKKQIHRIDMEKLSLEEYQIKNSDLSDETCNWIESAILNDSIYVFMQRNGSETGIFLFDGEREGYKPVSMEYFMNDFFENKSIFEEHIEKILPMAEILKNANLHLQDETCNVGKDIYQLMKEA